MRRTALGCGYRRKDGSGDRPAQDGFFNASYAHCNRCLDGRFRLVPDDGALAGLRSDYEAMRRARIVGAQAPDFKDLIERLRALEAEINRRS